MRDVKTGRATPRTNVFFCPATFITRRLSSDWSDSIHGYHSYKHQRQTNSSNTFHSLDKKSSNFYSISISRPIVGFVNKTSSEEVDN